MLLLFEMWRVARPICLPRPLPSISSQSSSAAVLPSSALLCRSEAEGEKEGEREEEEDRQRERHACMKIDAPMKEEEEENPLTVAQRGRRHAPRSGLATLGHSDSSFSDILHYSLSPASSFHSPYHPPLLFYPTLGNLRKTAFLFYLFKLELYWSNWLTEFLALNRSVINRSCSNIMRRSAQPLCTRKLHFA